MKRFLVLLFFISGSFLSAAPLITNITPNHGSNSGTAPVVITGSGFTGTTEVDVDGAPLPVGSFTVMDDSHITISNINVIPHVPENVTVVVKVGATSSTPNHPNDFYTYTGDWTLYIPGVNTDAVYAYDVNSRTLNPTPISLPTGSGPKDVVFDPFGKFAYVVNNKDDSVSVLNVATNSLLLSISLVGAGVNPNAIALSPTLSKAYITDSGISGFTVIDLTDPTNPLVTDFVSLVANDTSIGVAFMPDGTFAYIGGATSGNLYRIDSTFNSIIGTTLLPSTGRPGWITMKPNQGYGIVTDNVNSLIRTFDLTTTNPTFLGQASSAGLNIETEIVASRESDFAYDLNTSTPTINQFGVTTNSPSLGFTRSVTSTQPRGIWLTPDAKSAFVTSSNSTTISRIDGLPTTPTLSTFTIPASNSEWPCITPDQAPVARFTFTKAPGNTALFDGSGSVSPVGTIATWLWNFGDGNQETDMTPTTSHTYATNGPFTVTLTVTNTAGTSVVSSTTFTGQTFSNYGADFAETSQVVSFAPVPPMPPTNGAITQKVDAFLTQKCYENTITWSPPTSGPAPVYYIIYDAASTQVLGTITLPASGPLLFVICSKTAHATYYIFSVDATGTQSIPLVVSI